MRDLVTPLRERTFLLMWSATLLANLGFWMQDVTLGWLVSSLTSSPSLVAMVPAAAMLPTFVLSLPAGALGDIVDSRKLLIGMQSAIIAALLALALAIGLHILTIGGLLLFAFVAGTLNALASPSRQAILPSIVRRDDVSAAVMLNSISYNGSRAVGPLVGGMLLAAFGPMEAVLAYALACVAVLAVFCNWKPVPTVRPAKIDILGNVLDGLRYARRNGTLSRPLAMASVYFCCVAPLWAFVPLIARSFAAGNTGVFGMFMASIGLGAVLAGLSPYLNGSRGYFVSLRNSAALTAAAFFGIAAAPNIVCSLLAFLLAGVGWIGVSAGINSYVLLEADQAYRTRMIAVVMIVFSGSLSLGSILWGQAARHIGIFACFVVAGGCMLALALVVAWKHVPRGSGVRLPSRAEPGD
jgi:MFS family permease